MKAIKPGIAACLAACACASVYAQPSPDTHCAAPAAMPASAQGTQSNGGWVAPYGEPVHEKTRAEVYQELIQAEQDGQLAYLNSTVYIH